jgi:hypothetical protein
MHACMAGMGPELRVGLGYLTPGAPACPEHVALWDTERTCKVR